MVQRVFLSFFAACFLLVAACQDLGVVQPKTFTETLAFGYATNTAVRDTATNSLSAGVMTVEDAEKILQLTDQARGYLDQANSLWRLGQETEANTKLALGVSILRAAQLYMRSHSK